MLLIPALTGFCSPLSAHHSSHLFDTLNPIVLTGFIAEVRFANPHSSIFIDIEDTDGHLVRWAVENSGSLYATQKVRGFDGSKLQAGDPITVCGYAPKRAYTTTRVLQQRGDPVPAWWGSAEKFLTGRLLVLKGGPEEHWSHYGPLDVCQALLNSQ